MVTGSTDLLQITATEFAAEYREMIQDMISARSKIMVIGFTSYSSCDKLIMYKN